jgi:hypothetical protein
MPSTAETKHNHLNLKAALSTHTLSTSFFNIATMLTSISTMVLLPLMVMAAPVTSVRPSLARLPF